MKLDRESSKRDQPATPKAYSRAHTLGRASVVVLAGLGSAGLVALAAGSTPLPAGVTTITEDLRTDQERIGPDDAAPIPTVRDEATVPAPEASRGAEVDGSACVMQAPLSEVQLAEVLQAGYEAFYGRPATANRLACAWAHCAFEHGRGTKLFGNNLGHITTTGAWRGPTCVKSFTHKVSANPNRWASSSQTFRVHPTLEAGALDYWKLMDAQYPHVMIACDRGDSLAAARELRRRNYFTGPEDRYVQSLVQLYMEGLGSVLTKMAAPPWPIGPKPVR
jgi:hypothetical protein